VKQTDSPSFSSFLFSRLIVWFILPLLSALLFFGLTALPSPGDENPTFHVASRYLDRGTVETGFSIPVLAVFLDYRSFDLVFLSLFFIVMTLMALLIGVVENLPIRPFARVWAWGSLLSSFLLLAAGWVGLRTGSNFMDYEFWAGVFGPTARIHGAVITGFLVLATAVCSFIWTYKVLTSGKEKRFGHL
jgi:hypothetical protein